MLNAPLLGSHPDSASMFGRNNHCTGLSHVGGGEIRRQADPNLDSLGIAKIRFGHAVQAFSSRTFVPTFVPNLEASSAVTTGNLARTSSES